MRKFFIYLFVLFLCLPVLTYAETNSQSNTLLLRQMLYFEGGYFTARRGDFRDIYDTKLTPALVFEKRKNDKFGYGGRLNFNYFDNDDASLKIISFAATPFASYSVSMTDNMCFVIGLGNGISYRRITISNLTDYTGTPLDLSKSRNEFGLLGMVLSGFDLAVSRKTALGVRAYFDYFYTGDPTLGDLGDTGGLHIMGRIGFSL